MHKQRPKLACKDVIKYLKYVKICDKLFRIDKNIPDWRLYKAEFFSKKWLNLKS